MVAVVVRNNNIRKAVILLKRRLEKDGIHREVKERLMGDKFREQQKAKRAVRRRMRKALRRREC